MSLATATSTEGKGGHPARPAAGSCLPGITGMQMTPDQVEIIERLRAAAAEHGEVAILLDVLASTISVDDGDRAIVANDEDLEYLRAVMIAAAFANYDRREEGEG